VAGTDTSDKGQANRPFKERAPGKSTAQWEALNQDQSLTARISQSDLELGLLLQTARLFCPAA